MTAQQTPVNGPYDPNQQNGQYNPNQPNGQYNPNQQNGQQQPQVVSVNDPIVLYVLAFFIPPLAVFMQTGVCGNEFIIDLVLSCLFWLPGIIYAFYIVHRDQSMGIAPRVQLGAPQPHQPQYQQNEMQKQTV